MNFQIFILAIINSFSAVGYSLIAPLFPTLGKDKKIGEDIIGTIISFFPLSNFLIIFFVPTLIYNFGRKKIFYLAAILEGGCTIFYGFLIFFNNFYLFMFLAIITRLLHGAGCGITATLVYSLGSTLSEPEEIASCLAILEMSWSLGIAIGPFLGSILYHLGGYSLPFWILGLFFFISIYMIKYLNLKDLDNEEHENPPSFIKYFKYYSISIISCSLIIYVICNVYYFPSLTNHLTSKWNFSVETSSLMFIIPMFVYLISLFFVNTIVKKFGLFLNIFISHILLIIAPPFIYPLEFLPQNIFSIIFGLILIGLTALFINVQSLMGLSIILKKISPELENEIYNDLSSAIYNILMTIGDFLGPIIGGNISNKYGFKYSNIFVSLLCLIQTIIFGCYFKNEIIEEYYDGQKYIINDESEKKNNYLIGKHRKNLSSNSYIQRIEFDVINQQYI